MPNKYNLEIEFTEEGSLGDVFDSEEPIDTEKAYDTFIEPISETISEDETMGIIDKLKAKPTLTKEDVDRRQLFTKWFERYLNSIYKSFYKAEGKVTIRTGHEGGFVNLDSMEIVIYEKLIVDLWKSNIPPLLVFYHEIGHVLYTIAPVVDYGKMLKPDMFNLLNWIEDFFVESELMKKLYFIKPYIKMLHEVVPDHIDDWEKTHFALHYYYCYEGMVPRWMEKDKEHLAEPFKRYIETLKHLRASFASKFAREKFIRMFEEFYTFCIKHKILTAYTPPPPLEPRPKHEGGEGASKGFPGEEMRESESVETDAYKEDTGEDVPDSEIIRPPFRPLDPSKGFDPKFKELMDLMGKEYEKSLYDTFKLTKKGKPQLCQVTVHTASPRSLIDPIAIETGRSDFYLEYTLEEFSYTAYNLFIDVSGSVGHNKTFNQLGKDIIDIIKHYPYAVYGFGDDVIQWDQKKIDNILSLECRDSTESPIIGDIILEKKEIGNLNIILSDGDLSNLCRRPDIAQITKQYLFVFIVARGGSYEGYAKAHFAPNQYFVLNKVADLPAGIEALQEYIRTKGL